MNKRHWIYFFLLHKNNPFFLPSIFYTKSRRKKTQIAEFPCHKDPDGIHLGNSQVEIKLKFRIKAHVHLMIVCLFGKLNQVSTLSYAQNKSVRTTMRLNWPFWQNSDDILRTCYGRTNGRKDIFERPRRLIQNIPTRFPLNPNRFWPIFAREKYALKTDSRNNRSTEGKTSLNRVWEIIFHVSASNCTWKAKHMPYAHI